MEVLNVVVSLSLWMDLRCCIQDESLMATANNLLHVS